MAHIQITDLKSLSISSEFENSNLTNNLIRFGKEKGHDYISFLYFGLPEFPKNIYITRAELVLFTKDNYDNKSGCFYISPLIDNFNINTTYNNQPNVEFFTQKKFHVNNFKKTLSIDLTDIVCLWVKNRLQNKGLKLYCKNSDFLFSFYSSLYINKMYVPIINIEYRYIDECHKGEGSENKNSKFFCNCNYKSSSVYIIKVNGKVESNSIFDAVIELNVKREKSDKIDNYYIADEYNNLLNNNPIRIEKTYNFAIIPKLNKQDKTEIKIYGCYKSSSPMQM